MDELHWQNPMESYENNSTGYIHGNAKVHLFFEYGTSACKRYLQDVDYFNDVEVDDENECCKKCWKKYIALTGNGG
ncbi:hypothetical protein [Streptococcus pyogenes]|uniref:hypothetical protein n=1 Tax=Streptococcus pyogenes TaxID=1314 RepID=UPI0004A3A4B2|nr:hypothetical protein [Streptococcus pyogenes]AKG28368.1 hypothetical protein SPAP1_07080 [Streptococcus pyogenes]ONG56015.1 hypothetical protein BKN17_09270 [Streptococcus pyogenes]PWU77366.1 hypothetical protein DJ558_04015 [Streptococcus pyogenes]QAB34205.1 hypothetical protein DB248_02970 [Streptococcus pyogenes]QDC77975.1 hypothetical protein FIU13_08445 [Streptococcus pyogenes]